MKGFASPRFAHRSATFFVFPSSLPGPFAALALARLSPPAPLPTPRSRPFYDGEIETLCRLRLGPLAWRVVRRTPDAWAHVLSDQQRQKLELQYRGATMASVIAHQTMKIALRALQARPAVPFVAIKGYACAATIYPHPALRPFSDIDLWVAADRFDDAIERLRGCGYAGEPKSAAPFVAQLTCDNLFSLDVHRLIRQTARVAFDFEQAFAARALSQIDDLEVPMLSIEHLFVHQLYSLAASEFVQSFNTWIDLRELLIGHPDLLRRPAVIGLIDSCGLRPAVWAVLTLLRELFPELELDDAIDAFRPAPAEQLLLGLFLPRPDQLLGWNPRRGRQLAIKAALIEGVPRRTKFLASYLGDLGRGFLTA